MTVTVKFENENVRVFGVTVKENIIYKVTAHVVDDEMIGTLLDKADSVTVFGKKLNQAKLEYSNPKIEKRIMNLINFYRN